MRPTQERQCPYLVVWKGKKKKLSEGKDHRKTSKHAGRPHPVVIPQAFPNDPCPLPAPGLGTPCPSASLKPGCGCSGVSYQLKHLFLSPTFPDTLKGFLPSICTSNQSTYDTELLSLFHSTICIFEGRGHRWTPTECSAHSRSNEFILTN